MDTRLVEQSRVELSERAKVAIAWAIACDGTIAIHSCRSKKGRKGLPGFVPYITVSSVDYPLVKAVRELAGCGTLRPIKRLGYRPVFRWSLYRTIEAKKLLEQIIDYLPIKREQAHLVIELCKIRLQPGRLGPRPRLTFDLEKTLYGATCGLNAKRRWWQK